MARRKRRKIDADQLTTIVAPRGRRVHACALSAPADTACGQKIAARSWRLKPGAITCARCIEAIYYPVRRGARAVIVQAPIGNGRRRTRR